MFTVLALLISYSLLTFGAVLANDWFVLKIFWISAIAGCLIFSAVRQEKWRFSFLLLFVAAALLFRFAEPKLAIGLVAGVWAWVAAKQNGEAPTLRFFHVLIVIGLLESLLGLVQFFISPGWILGYINPFNRSSGTLINRNHFAGLLEMFIPITLGYAYISVRRYREMARPYTYLLAGAFMGLALIFSVSRMGVFSFLLTLLFLAILLRVRDSQRRLATALGLGFIVLLTSGALWIGLDAITVRFSELAGEEAILRDGRLLVYRDTVRMIADDPLGVGMGHYQDRFRQYQVFHPDVLFDHAHNDYLETTAEWGIPAAVAFWSFVVAILISAVRKFVAAGSPERRGILLACIGAIFSLLVHSLSDFNLQIPSNAMLFFTFVGIAAAFSFPGGLSSKEIEPDRYAE